MRRGHPRINIESVHDYNSICDDMLTDFLEDFDYERGLIRDPDKEDYENFDTDEDSCELGFMYTQKAMRLYETFCRRLSDLGKKHFDEEDLNIESSSMIFP